jgi:beta-lactamase superfamily II metal-dependent hydrolase
MRVVFALLVLGPMFGVASFSPGRAGATGNAVPCSTSGTWTQGEVNLYWFDVEQGDSQLIVGPTGKTLLIDLGETSFNTTGANTKATSVASKIRTICGTGTAPVALDYVMVSHHHLDHIGYAANPNDTANYGNGLYQLLTPNGHDFTVGTFIDRDAGTWTDTNSNNSCEVGTSTTPSNEIAWHNAGTTSQTSRRLICWLYGPSGQADRANIEGHVTTITNNAAYPTINLGTGVTVSILNANGKDTMQADGVTPVSGDHTTQGGSGPPSENDYSVAVKVAYGNWEYATAGDSDGESNTSSFGYTYNDIEAKIGPLFDNVETMRANHHGSGHSSNQLFIDTLKPETVFISCGDNSYGHPSNRVTNALNSVTNDAGTGADIYLANNPCDQYQSDGTTLTDYTGMLNSNGDVVLRTTNTGTGYTIYYGSSSNSYAAYAHTPTPTPTNTATPTNTPTNTPTATATPAGPSSVVINEYLMAPQTTHTMEWIELYNPSANSINIGGLYLDDLAAGGGSPKQIPANTTISAGGYYVMDIASGFLNNTGSDSVRFLSIVSGVETVYDSTSYSLGSTQYDKVFRRTGNGGSWCATISTNVSKGTANPNTCP